MTVDLVCLVVNALWGLALVQIEIFAKTRVAGPAWNLGNRETAPTFPAWIDRTSRALANHKENFPLFLTAIVVVHLAGRADRATAAAAIVYVLGRFAHGLLYIGGITRVRSAAFMVAILANLALFVRLLV